MICAKLLSIIWMIFSIRYPKTAQELYSEPQRNYYKGQKGQSPSSHLCSGDLQSSLSDFPELTSIQTAVDRWNETTEETIAQFDQVYFVPINDLLYKGIDGKMGVSEISMGRQPLSMMPCMKRIAFTLTIRAMKRWNKQYWRKSMPRRKLGLKNNPIKEKIPFLQKLIFGNGCF